MDFYNSRKHIAKKEHICEMCGEKINVGEKYYRQSGKFDGEFFDRKLHIHCGNMMEEFCGEVDNVFSWDEVTDYIQDNYCFDCKGKEYLEECDLNVTSCPKIKKLFSERNKDE